jgi:16S rRNA (cytosine967-C5)-methyltransferase
VVATVADRGKSLDSERLDEPSAQERGLLRSLVYGTVRWHIRLAAILTELLDQPPHKLDSEIRALTLVGLFQLLHTDIAPHAAIAETVEAARILRRPRAAGLVNAVLRRAQRESAVLLPKVDTSLATRTAHPEWLVNELHRDWPDDVESILNANNEHPPFWLRVNSLRTTRDDYIARLAREGIQSSVIESAPDALLLAKAMDVRVLPGFNEGWVSVQDAAAQLAAPLLELAPGQRVLDACAAPGGKACHALELEPRIAELVAVDIAKNRLRRIGENLERLGLAATLLAGDASEPEAWWDGKRFDRVLLDIPCSATGVIRRHPDIKLLRRPQDITALNERQRVLLERLWPLVAPGGRLLYASCSALRAENTDIVAAFLAQHPEAKEHTPRLGLPPSRPDAGPGLRIAAGEAGMDGFYYACIDKNA